MSIDSAFNEKRQEPRFLADANVAISIEGFGTLYGTCLNVSSSGLLIRTSESLEKGLRVQLELIEAGKRIQADGRVIHSRQNQNGYLIGLKASFSF